MAVLFPVFKEISTLFYIAFHLFLISSASVRSIEFLSFFVPIFAWNVPPVVLIFLNRSLDIPILLFSSISLHCSLRMMFLSLLFSLWNTAFTGDIFPFLLCLSLLFSDICRPVRQPFCLFAFLFLGDCLDHCLLYNWHEPQSILPQALCLSDLTLWICLSLLLYNHKGFDSDHTWMG